MKIIRERPSASCPPVLDEKNYSYWKPRMIFFIKTLDGKVWRAFVTGYKPSMITVDGVSVPKPEVDWTNAEEQASIRNARTINAIFNENKKGKGIAFKSTYEEEATVNHSDNEANMDEKDAENTTRRYNEVSNRRIGDYRKKKEEEGKFFKCRECGGISHYQVECPIFLRRKKESCHAILSDEDTEDTEDDGSMNVFTTYITEIDLRDDSDCSDEDGDEDMTLEELRIMRKEDNEARAIQKERIQELMEESEHLMSVISFLKLKLKEVQNDYNQTIKFVKMLNSGTENLDLILKSGQNSSSKYDLGFDVLLSSHKSTSEVKFVPALVKVETETTLTTTVASPPVKSPRRICYFCAATQTYDEDDETLNIRVDSSTKVLKADAQADGTSTNSNTTSKEVIADNSKLVPSAHVRGWKFKSTPPRRPYHLPSEKSQVEVSRKLPKFVRETDRATLGTHALHVPETLLFDMDSDDLDDVPFARLLKKTIVPEDTVKMPTTPSASVHYQESSSTEGVFVPTPSIHHNSNVQPKPSIHSPPSASLPSEPNVAHASIPGNVSTAPEGRTDVQSDENEVDPPNPDFRSEEVPADADNNPTVPPGFHEIPVAP
ncbi:envelope-like protein [Cucumis melo var. makuwa]|uniref:Envelope-like protein n=1 Tax=Cucumis melo var. makuwa TaxID=1194695 RepID=A0A5D3CJU2_CUCMM|nr:envelope-like protein [Cucumis melo var. makuwa]